MWAGRALAVMAACALACCAHVGEPPDDATLTRLERAFAGLRAGGSHARARRDLEVAARAFDELALPGSSLEEALASDPEKPYRGRPWERALALTLLAALDAERGRCDLAVPTLKSAALHDARAAPDQASDAPVIYLLLLRCLRELEASEHDVARARDELARSLALDGGALTVAELERAALAPTLRLAFDGAGPALASTGRYGEGALVHADAADAARPQVARARPEHAAVVVRIGRDAPRGPADTDEGLALWSSARQASSVGGRPFDEVLRERAAMKASAMGEGERLFADGLRRAHTPRETLGALATAAAGAGLFAAGAVVDARADLRRVESLFGRVVAMP